MLVESTLRLIGFILGAALQLFLAGVVVRKRGAGRVERLALVLLAAGGLWQAAVAVGLFLGASTGLPTGPLLAAVEIAGLAGAVLAVFGVAGCWLVSRRQEGYRRRVLVSLGAALLVPPPAALLAGPASAAVVWSWLLPPACLAYYIYRYHLLGLFISRRLPFALTLGMVSAMYLLVVKRAAEFLEDEFGAFRALVELALIFAAALGWLPIYGWMNRFFSQRARLYTDFSKRIIEDAARILDLGKRVQFLAEEVGRAFGFRRAVLVSSGPPACRGEFGPPGSSSLPEIEQLVRAHDAELLRAGEEPALAAAGFHYLFPLRYQDRFTGVLLLDISPRMFLDEDETILLGLSRQISHSIETCRVIDEKIGLERTLVRQEHLASLGKVAAAIAHEVRNPLSSIKTLAQLMREDPQVEQRYSRDLGFMVGEIERLNRSVQQLLSFSRPASEAAQTVNLTELLETTASVLARQYAESRIGVESRIAPRLLLEHSNAELVQQVVLNLALNAIQASPPGTAVRLEADSLSPETVRIVISDAGPGIPPEIQERIFEPFFTTKQKGTGLGLSIVRKNVRHLRGDIRIESPIANGHGARVEVTLPAQ